MEVNVQLLKLRDLSFSYDGKTEVLKKINLDFSLGEKIALLGSNGAGKSTLFSHLVGLLHGDGEIALEDQVLSKGRKEQEKLRETVGLVFQNPDDQIIAPTVFSEVAFGPLNQGRKGKEMEEDVEESLRIFSLLDKRNLPPHYLSGGEKKKLTLADILVMKPKLFILDEPTASLDPLHVDLLTEQLRNIEATGACILLATHDMEFAYGWAKRWILLSEGKVLFDGEPLDILSRPEILEEAGLRPPLLYDVAKLLQEKEMIEKDFFPRSIEELKEIL